MKMFKLIKFTDVACEQAAIANLANFSQSNNSSNIPHFAPDNICISKLTLCQPTAQLSHVDAHV